ncbi:phycobiliprotein lyase [Geminocystis sp. NIES-3709]|uniref:phycobiliprotein lyase n=1 Tax=Geminocystis sp. NIES-3709 TaxID=1617448 RepID=UPI0005FCA961|nr:phycobiliprotein lyase [Geminocystis sp. NIES-3709]BAQ66149.1 phycoerythrin linker protein CpeS homolog [Geminocystis sp. NIES-3709]
MTIAEFVQQSLGSWRSLRSVHHLAFSYLEEVKSEIEIISLNTDDPEVINLCKEHNIDPDLVQSPFRMTWEGESDWDVKEELKGTTVLVPLPDPQNPDQGRLLRDRGYAETMPAIANYEIQNDGTFVLTTNYDRASAEEKIWFINPKLRFRVSMIKTSDGKGVTTASFSSEIKYD